MGSASNYLSDEVLKWSTGQTNDLGTAATPYMALGTGTTEDAFTELADSGSYARVDVSGKWGAPSSGEVLNNALIAFAAATGTWGTVTEASVWTSGTHGDGEMLWRWTLGVPKAVLSGDNVEFQASAIRLAMS